MHGAAHAAALDAGWQARSADQERLSAERFAAQQQAWEQERSNTAGILDALRSVLARREEQLARLEADGASRSTTIESLRGALASAATERDTLAAALDRATAHEQGLAAQALQLGTSLAEVATQVEQARARYRTPLASLGGRNRGAPAPRTRQPRRRAR